MKYRLLAILIFAVQVGFGQIYIDSYRFGSAGPTLPNIVTDNLIAWYDASVSSSYPGSGSIWFDLSGNDRDLTISGATYLSDNGGIFDFDGVNDFMSYSTNVNESVKSISIWFKSDLNFNNTIIQTLLDMGDHSSIYYMIYLGNVTGDISTEKYSLTQVIGSTIRASYLTTTPSNPNTWYNLIINYNGTDYDFYINNIFYAKINVGYPHSVLFNLLKIGIGKSFQDNAIFFNGQIGELFIYNEALTTQQLTDNYNATKTRYGY